MSLTRAGLARVDSGKLTLNSQRADPNTVDIIPKGNKIKNRVNRRVIRNNKMDIDESEYRCIANER